MVGVLFNKTEYLFVFIPITVAGNLGKNVE